MGTPLVFEGRPRKGPGMNIAYGSMLLLMGILILVMSWQIMSGNSLPLLAFILFLALGGTVLISLGLLQFRTHKVEVDEIGVRLYIGKEQKWELAWNEVRGLGTARVVGSQLPFNAIIIRTEGKPKIINDESDLGPAEKLKEAFRAIVAKGMRPEIFLEDGLGWAAGLQIPDHKGPAANLQENRWHESSRAPPMSIMLLVLGASTIPIGLIIYLLSLPDELVCFGPILGIVLIMGIFSIALGYYIYRTTILSLKFDSSGIGLRFRSGISIDIKWADVTKCSYGNITQRIFLASGTSNWDGYFSREVLEALCQKYTEVTGRKYDTVSSPF
jgi:hypothetical protein